MRTRPILFILLLIIISFKASSQTTYGFRAGINLANSDFFLDGIKLSSSSVAGLNLGAFINFSIKDNFSFQPELNFSQTGNKFEGIKETFNYIAIPFLGKYTINNLGLFAGPQFSILTSSEKIYEYDDIDRDNLEIKPTELSALLGVDYSVNKIILGVRYQFGITNVWRNSKKIDQDMFEDQKLRNRALTFSIGYRF